MKSANENKNAKATRSRVVRKAGRPRDEVAGGADLVMRAELVSLREENARLRMARNAQPGMQQTIDRLRSATSDHVVSGPGADLADEADQLWHVLAEAVAIREGLLAACRDLAAAAASLEVRLEGLIPRFNAAQQLGDELENLIFQPAAEPEPEPVAAEPEPAPVAAEPEPEPEPVAADPNSVVIDLTERTEDHQVQPMQEGVADDGAPAFNGATT